jgi:hypothetical protein
MEQWFVIQRGRRIIRVTIPSRPMDISIAHFGANRLAYELDTPSPVICLQTGRIITIVLTLTAGRVDRLGTAHVWEPRPRQK